MGLVPLVKTSPVGCSVDLSHQCVWEKGGGGERERERERDRERDRQTDRQTGRQTETERDRERQRQKQRQRQTDRQRVREREREGGGGGRQTDRERQRQRQRQTDRREKYTPALPSSPKAIAHTLTLSDCRLHSQNIKEPTATTTTTITKTTTQRSVRARGQRPMQKQTSDRLPLILTQGRMCVQNNVEGLKAESLANCSICCYRL